MTKKKNFSKRFQVAYTNSTSLFLFYFKKNKFFFFSQVLFSYTGKSLFINLYLCLTIFNVALETFKTDLSGFTSSYTSPIQNFAETFLKLHSLNFFKAAEGGDEESQA